MSIQFLCPHCRKQWEVGERHAGRQIRCGACQGEFIIPSPPPPSPPAPSSRTSPAGSTAPGRSAASRPSRPAPRPSTPKRSPAPSVQRTAAPAQEPVFGMPDGIDDLLDSEALNEPGPVDPLARRKSDSNATLWVIIGGVGCVACLVVTIMVMSWLLESDSAPQAARDGAAPASASAGSQATGRSPSRNTLAMPSGMTIPASGEVRDFAKALEKQIARCQGDPIGTNLRLDLLIERVLKGVGASGSQWKQFVEGFRRGLRSRSQSAAVFQVIRAGGSYQFVHTREKDGWRRMLFRLAPADGGVGYQEFYVAKHNGKIQIIDYYDTATGQLFSETLRQIVVMSAQALPSFWNNITGKTKQFVEAAKLMQQLRAAVDAGQHSAALETYDKMPAEHQKNKFVMVLRMTAAAAMSDRDGGKAYREAVVDFNRLFPNDPAADLLAFDYYFNEEDYAEARACMERLDASIGGDPYVDGIVAVCYLKEEQWDKAKAAALRCQSDAKPLDLTIENALVVLAAVALQQGDFDDAVEHLREYRKVFGKVDESELRRMPRWSEFARSEAYRDWKRQR